MFKHIREGIIVLFVVWILFLFAFVRGVSNLLIAIKQPHFNAQKGRLNEQSLAEKIDSKILISYGIESNITIYRKSAF